MRTGVAELRELTLQTFLFSGVEAKALDRCVRLQGAVESFLRVSLIGRHSGESGLDLRELFAKTIARRALTFKFREPKLGAGVSLVIGLYFINYCGGVEGGL